MKSICFYALMFFASEIVFSQEIGVWKNYTNMSNVREASISGNDIWAATEGGVFRYDLTSEEFTTFTKSENLSSQNITAINIDNDGKIWIGSQEGFINVYNPSDNSISKILDIYSTDYASKQINNIFIDGTNVYISTDFGLSVIDSKTLSFNETVLKFGNFLSESKVYKVNVINSIPYVTTVHGIAVLKSGATNLSAPESWETFSLGTDISASEVYKIIELQGAVIVSTEKGLFMLDNNSWKSYLFSGNVIKDMSVNGNVLYVLLSNELYKITETGNELIYNSSNTLNSVLVKDEMDIYVGSQKGIKHISETGVVEITPNGPASNFFQNLSVDTEGNLWSGTGKDGLGAGILKFDGSEWTVFNTSSNPELLSNDYHKVYAASDGNVYSSNWGDGFAKYENGNFSIYNTSNTDLVGISTDPEFLVIDAMGNDLNNNTWMVNYWSQNAKPLSVLTSDNKWYHYSVSGVGSTTLCVLLAIDRNNTKWFSVQDGTKGLYYFNENNTFENTLDDSKGFLNTSSGLHSSDIQSIVVDQRGEVWVGTTLGIDIIRNPATPTTGITRVYSVRFETISTIAVDPINQKWVGTQNGIYVLAQDGVGEPLTIYSTSNSPLPTNIINSIAFDANKGIAYIGTDLGLSTLTTSSIEPEEQFNELFVYPNPFILDGKTDQQITIDGLIKDSQIKILSITGKLIKEFASPGGRVAFWDGKNEKGNLVSSGVYIIVAYDTEASNVAKTKVAVIRK